MKRTGFTLIELLVVVALSAVMLITGFAYLGGYRSEQNLKLTASEVLANVQNTQSFSKSQENGQKWGIRFSNSTSSSGQSYSVFSGTGFASGTISQTYALRRNIVFGNPSVSSTIDVIFNAITGFVPNNQVISLVTGRSDGFVDDIIMNTLGQVKSKFDTGLVGYWHLDEGTATTTYDASGNGNTGTLTNGPTWQTGTNCKAGSCLSFNGSTNSIQVPDASILNFGAGDFSVIAWVKLNNSNSMRFVNKWLNSSVVGWIFDGNETTTGTNQPGYLRFRMGDGTHNFDYAANGNLNNGNWHNIAVTLSRSSTTGLKLYVDGQQIGTSQDPTAVTGSVSASTPFGIGVIPSILGSYFNGNIDEVRLYNRALSATEVSDIYNSTR